MTMRSRPANIRVISRRFHRIACFLLCASTSLIGLPGPSPRNLALNKVAPYQKTNLSASCNCRILVRVPPMLPKDAGFVMFTLGFDQFG